MYWLRSLGVDLSDRDIFSRLYILYILAILVIWVAVSFSLVLNLAVHLGHPISPKLYLGLGITSWILGILVITLSSSTSPLYLTHGDIQWLASSPLSPRLLIPFHLPFRQMKAFLMAALLASLVAAAVHDSHIEEFALTQALWILSCQAAGWNLSALHYSRSRKPLRFFWVGVILALILLSAIFHHLNQTLILALTPGHLHPDTFVAPVAGLWLLTIFTSARINLVNVHEASTLFADIDQLGTIYLPNRGMVQEIRTRKRFAQKRVLGHLPLWSSPWYHTGRVMITALRRPRYIWSLVELALLFRSALLLLSPQASRWTWLFWIFIAYRFRQGNMAFVSAEDVLSPFLNQFRPLNKLRQFLLSTWLPFLFVFVTSLVFWLIIPLTVSLSLPHFLYLSSLILAWALGEGVVIIRNPLDHIPFLNDYHLVAVSASALVMMLALTMGHVWLTPVIPLGLMLAMILSNKKQTIRDPLGDVHDVS